MVQAPAVTAADPICDIFANGYDVTGAAPCATCFDGVTDHDETDADCGGAWCKACADSKQCLVNSDCISTLCNPGPHTCSPATCLDGSKDGGETDVDCGGGACPVCAVGMQCIQSTDCTSRVCAFGICQAPACNDGVKNGAETDVDCGGGICPVCALGLQCNTDADCASNACDALTNLCVANQCADHRKDGQESDADCGGGICPACTPGLQCNQNSDCGSNNCSGGMCLCNTDVDCASNACDALTNLCVANQCADHRKDGQETDVDCGGGVCALCATGNQCVIGSDCVSGICSGNTCQ